jgi:3-hydroxymyristoyl/3-hydroxydecanoyl-(acyl carrier protein) dehydratase
VTRFAEAGFTRVSRPSDRDDRVSFRIDASSRLFDGHFDGAPILPGVAHIALAISACAERGLARRPLRAVRDVRFSHPLGPDDDVEVTLTPGRDAASVRFDIRAHGRTSSSGLLVFASDADARG